MYLLLKHATLYCVNLETDVAMPMSQCRCCYACALLTAVAFAALAVADAMMPVEPSPPHHTAKRTAGARGVSHVRARVPNPQLVPQVVPQFVLSHADTAEGFQIASVLLRRLNSVPPTSVGVPLVAGVTDLKSPYARLLEQRGAKVPISPICRTPFLLDVRI